MNSTVSRIGIAVPFAAAIFGWSLSAAQAAPYQPSDKIEVQPAEHAWPDDIAIPEPDDVDEPEDVPADEPEDVPADEPADEDEDTDDESDEDSDEDSNDGGQSAPAPKNDNGSNGGADSTDDAADEADTIETASTAPIAPSFRPAGVQVPLLMVVGAGALLTGVAGWAGYRRYQLYAH
jgi:hypothetical protein